MFGERLAKLDFHNIALIITNSDPPNKGYFILVHNLAEEPQITAFFPGTKCVLRLVNTKNL